MKSSEIKQFTSWLGKRSDKARLERLGLETASGNRPRER